MSVEAKKSRRGHKKTTLTVLADLIVYIQNHKEEIPKQQRAAIRWAAKKFPAANERAIVMAFEKVGVKFVAKRRDNGRSGLRGLASKSDIAELWSAMSQMNQLVFLLSGEIEQQIGSEANTFNTDSIAHLRSSIVDLHKAFLERNESKEEGQ